MTCTQCGKPHTNPHCADECIDCQVVGLMAALEVVENEIAKYHEFVREVALEPYADSDPASLLDALRSRARALIFGE